MNVVNVAFMVVTCLLFLLVISSILGILCLFFETRTQLFLESHSYRALMSTMYIGAREDTMKE